MSIVSSSRKKYTPEYRQEAARLVLESGRPIAHVAKEIGVAEGLLGKWVKLERERQGSDDGAVMPIYEPKTPVYDVSWLRPRWITSSCQKPPPSSLRSNAIGKI